MKIIRYTLLGIVLLALAGCGQRGVPPQVASDMTATAVAAAEPAETPDAAPTTPPVTGTTILADGQLVAVNPPLALGFEANGRVLEIMVQAGQQVAAGDVLATLDDAALQEALTNAQIQQAQAENSLAQAQLAVDDLLNWQPDETAVALAEANVAAAEAGLENAETSDSLAGNSLTSAQVNLNRAERSLTDAQAAYDTAHDPGRDWELGDPFRSRALEAERDGTARSLQSAQENLQVARAQYNLAVGGLNNDTAVSAQAQLLNAQQALAQATDGPGASEIRRAQLQVEQAAISLEQSQIAVLQAEQDLAKAELVAPWGGTISAVAVSPGAFVGAGTAVVTLIDTEQIQFQTSNLSERDLAQVNAGQPVEVVLKTYPTQPIGGRVVGVVPQAAGTVGDAAVFTVLVDMDASELNLRPGMTGRAEIQAGSN